MQAPTAAPGAEAEARTGAETDAEAGAGTGIDAGADAGAGAGAGAETDVATRVGTETEAGARIGAETGAGTRSGAGVEAENAGDERPDRDKAAVGASAPGTGSGTGRCRAASGADAGRFSPAGGTCTGPRSGAEGAARSAPMIRGTGPLSQQPEPTLDSSGTGAERASRPIPGTKTSAGSLPAEVRSVLRDTMVRFLDPLLGTATGGSVRKRFRKTMPHPRVPEPGNCAVQSRRRSSENEKSLGISPRSVTVWNSHQTGTRSEIGSVSPSGNDSRRR